MLATACSSTPKKTPELSKLEGKKVALVEIQSEDTARRVVETALVNQLIRTGSFILVSKSDLEKARSAPEQDPRDLNGLAQRAGAEVALRANVLRFNADEREGYSEETIKDSQLAEERGDSGETQRLYKVKSLDAQVQVELKFTDLKTQDERTGIAKAQEQATAEGKTSAIHLPPKLRLLEKVANDAFRKFFETYH